MISRCYSGRTFPNQKILRLKFIYTKYIPRPIIIPTTKFGRVVDVLRFLRVANLKETSVYRYRHDTRRSILVLFLVFLSVSSSSSAPSPSFDVREIHGYHSCCFYFFIFFFPVRRRQPPGIPVPGTADTISFNLYFIVRAVCGVRVLLAGFFFFFSSSM